MLSERIGRAGNHRLTTLRMMLNVLSDGDCEINPERSDNEPEDAYLTGTLMTLQAYRLIRLNRFDAARRRASRARELLHEQGSRYGAIYAEILVCMANRAVGNMESVAQQCERMLSCATSKQIRLGRGPPPPDDVALRQNRIVSPSSCAESSAVIQRIDSRKFVSHKSRWQD